MNPLTHIRPEMALLLACASAPTDHSKSEQIRLLLQKEIDWPYLKRMAHQHGLASLLFENLRTFCIEKVPEDILIQLREHTIANARRNLFLTGELLRILHLFESNDISAIPYKGPVLAAWAYGDIALREFSDLDILIPKEDVLRARDLLVSQGYRLPFQIDEGPVVHQKSQYEVLLTLGQSRVHVELKWEIIDGYFSCPLDVRGLWSRRRPILLADREVFTFSPEDLLLVLCIHGTKHLWTSLMWVCDVAALVRVSKDLDWDWLLGTSNFLGIRRMLFLGLFLAKTLLGTSLPEEVGRQVEADRSVKGLAEEVWRRIFGEPNLSPSLWASLTFHCKARERLKDRARYGYRLLVTTTPGDRALLEASSSLSPLSPYIRPFRLAGKYGKSLAKRLLTTVNTV